MAIDAMEVLLNPISRIKRSPCMESIKEQCIKITPFRSRALAKYMQYQIIKRFSDHYIF